MKFILLALVIALVVILGGCCCGSTPSDSGSYGSYGSSGNNAPSSGCQYGTYEEACGAQCRRLGGGTNCVSTCVNDVQAEGMGSGSTCCKATFRTACREFCESNNGEGYDSVSECATDCIAQYEQADYDVDACATAS